MQALTYRHFSFTTAQHHLCTHFLQPRMDYPIANLERAQARMNVLDDTQRQNVRTFVYSPRGESGDETYKRIATFYYVMGLTYDQIAHHLHISNTTIKNVISVVPNNPVVERPDPGGSGREDPLVDVKEQVRELLTEYEPMTFMQLLRLLRVSINAPTLYSIIEQLGYTFKNRSKIINGDCQRLMAMRYLACCKILDFKSDLERQAAEAGKRVIWCFTDQSGFKANIMFSQKYISLAGHRVFTKHDVTPSRSQANIMLFVSQFGVEHCYYHKNTSKPADWDDMHLKDYQNRCAVRAVSIADYKKRLAAWEHLREEIVQKRKQDSLEKRENKKLITQQRNVNRRVSKETSDRSNARVAAVHGLNLRQLAARNKELAEELRAQKAKRAAKYQLDKAAAAAASAAVAVTPVKKAPQKKKRLNETIVASKAAEDDWDSLNTDNEKPVTMLVHNPVVRCGKPEGDEAKDAKAKKFGIASIFFDSDDDDDLEDFQEEVQAHEFVLLKSGLPAKPREPKPLAKFKSPPYRPGMTTASVAEAFSAAGAAMRRKYPDDIIVMCLDNAPIHRDSVGLGKNVDYMVYLPPYSPEVNTCEPIFSGAKAHVSNYVVKQFTGGEWEEALKAVLVPYFEGLVTQPYFDHVWGLMKAYRDCDGSMQAGSALYNKTKGTSPLPNKDDGSDDLMHG